MCLTCHQSGTAADTDVWNGIYGELPNSDNLNWGTAGGTLLGGGFARVGGTAPAGEPATSAHTMDLTAVPAGSVSGLIVKLECTSCHNIHHDFTLPEQYRLLRARVGDAAGPLSVPWNGPWNWDGASQTTVDFSTPQSPTGTYMAYTEVPFGAGITFTPPDVYGGAPKEYTRNYRNGISAWCSGCHTKYMERKDAASYDARDSQGLKIRYRHAIDVQITVDPAVPGPGIENEYVNGIFYKFETDEPLEDRSGDGRTWDDTMMCLTCHRAHGTNATMHADIAPLMGDRGELPTGSMLLRLDNRQVCQAACHKVI
jgi:cytochrome c553